MMLGEAGSCGGCDVNPQQRQLGTGEEAQIEPAEDVVHQALA